MDVEEVGDDGNLLRKGAPVELLPDVVERAAAPD